MQNPKVSIIVPVYNTEKYLKTCLDSILNQTLREIEVICVDDGSTDNSLHILSKYAAQDSRIKVISQKNSGAWDSRNTGLKYTVGEYLTFVDSDDYIELNMCEHVYNVALSANADIVVYGGNAFPPAQWADNNLTINGCEYHNDSINALVYETGSRPFCVNKFYKRTLIMDNNLFFPNLQLGEDQAWLFIVFPKASHIIYIPERFYHYRQNRKESTMEKFSADKELKLKQHQKIVEFVYKQWREKGYFELYGQHWAYWCLTFFGKDVVNTVYTQASDIAPWIVERTKLFSNLIDENSRNILEELQFLINDPRSFYEERLKDSEDKLRIIEKKLKNTEEKLNASLLRETALKESISFRVGRIVTWGPRKLRDGMRCYSQHGLFYAVKRLSWHITHLK